MIASLFVVMTYNFSDYSSKIRNINKMIEVNEKEFKEFFEYVRSNSYKIDKDQVKEVEMQFRENAKLLNKALELATTEAAKNILNSLNDNYFNIDELYMKAAELNKQNAKKPKRKIASTD